MNCPAAASLRPCLSPAMQLLHTDASHHLHQQHCSNMPMASCYSLPMLLCAGCQALLQVALLAAACRSARKSPVARLGTVSSFPLTWAAGPACSVSRSCTACVTAPIPGGLQTVLLLAVCHACMLSCSACRDLRACRCFTLTSDADCRFLLCSAALDKLYGDRVGTCLAAW